MNDRSRIERWGAVCGLICCGVFAWPAVDSPATIRESAAAATLVPARAASAGESTGRQPRRAGCDPQVDRCSAWAISLTRHPLTDMPIRRFRRYRGKDQRRRDHHPAPEPDRSRPPARPRASWRRKSGSATCRDYYKHMTVTVKPQKRLACITSTAKSRSPGRADLHWPRSTVLEGDCLRRWLHRLCQQEEGEADPRQMAARRS